MTPLVVDPSGYLKPHGGTLPSGGEDESTTVVVPCSSAIDAVDDVGPSYVTHGSDGGFVALPSSGWLPSGVLQLGRMGSAGSKFEGLRFSKFELLVRRDRVVSLEVVSSPGKAVLEYVHPDTPARAIRGCSGLGS